MKLIYEPKVYLVSRPVIAGGTVFDFLKDHGVSEWHTNAPKHTDELPELAGRLCYMSFDKPRPGGNAGYLRHIKEVCHGSVLEHTCIGMIFTGVSRSLTHELVRHRVGVAYSQLSQRYVDESVGEYVVPWELQPAVKAFTGEVKPESMPDDEHKELCVIGRDWMYSVDKAHKTYVATVDRSIRRIVGKKLSRRFTDQDKAADVLALIEKTEDCTTIRKAARGASRSVLPNATETKIMVTANARAWRHMVEQRCSRHADAEIRILFAAALGVLKREAPNLFGDYRLVGLVDGTEEAQTEYRKV